LKLKKTSLLVIFDCDGVLVDTELAANVLLSDLIRAEGWDMSVEECHKRFVGKAMQAVQAEVGQHLGRALPEDWYLMVKEMTIKALSAGTRAVPGVEDQIRRLREVEIPYCVGSSGQIEKMHATLGSAGLLPLVEDALFSADMVGIGKPAPDLFLHAADVMGHAAEACVVIEDSVPGVQAGVTAGMKVLGYAGDPMTNRDTLTAAGALVFDDMAQLPALLSV
jgi:beta-phosphoglucomutase-like phosphatase (HAD superfamily)